MKKMIAALAVAACLLPGLSACSGASAKDSTDQVKYAEAVLDLYGQGKCDQLADWYGGDNLERFLDKCKNPYFADTWQGADKAKCVRKGVSSDLKWERMVCTLDPKDGGKSWDVFLTPRDGGKWVLQSASRT